MRIFLVWILNFFVVISSFSQGSKLKSKYPSLLWEITGKGLGKPSYLFGTMHVSNKMVFHLSDSFYLALKNADIVALETDPGKWQEDFSRYDLEGAMYNFSNRQREDLEPADYLSVNTLKAFPYEKLMERALYSSPSIINSFLYRTNSEGSSDFEEDTYLDLYIYQVGKKWYKKVCGVENFDESMTLMREAYADAAKDKNVRDRNYDIDNDFSYGKLEEAYRTGNLDLLDTINKVNSTSAAFDEKFLYRRNAIQAASIDSILTTRAALFVGVGAAHLPGERGVIELLRAKGYRLRPIKMKERDSRHKEAIEAIRVPVQFSQQKADDGFFTVNLPGKLYSFARSFGWMDQQQYADMSNGSYYMVTRIHTNSALWGHSLQTVERKLDSILYENIPGKILSKKNIVRNGYRGFDILNRTRRGDYQRYNIFITPFEILIFKISGNGDYVQIGKETAQFLNSIQFKEFRPLWKKYSPAFGGFEVEMPHEPMLHYAGNWQFLAYDEGTSTNFEVIRTDIHNIKFVEEDAMDLNLLEESFVSSDFIEKRLASRPVSQNGYAALETKYLYKDGTVALVRFIIRGPHYYTLIANSVAENVKMRQFLNSFTVKPFVYGTPQKVADTSLSYFTLSPVPIYRQRKLDMYPKNTYRYGTGFPEEDSLEETGIYKDRVVACDSTGEKIYVSFAKPSRYARDTDQQTGKDSLPISSEEQEWLYRKRKDYIVHDGIKVMEVELGDPRSSRILRVKSFNRGGLRHVLVAEGDTLSQWSSFVTSFFDAFIPLYTEPAAAVKKADRYFDDFFSSDTVLHRKAVKNIGMIKPDSTDLGNLVKLVESLSWKEKKYLEVKNEAVYKFSEIVTKASADYLKQVYYRAGDTVDLQYAVLEALLRQKTAYAYSVFRDIMTSEPPVLEWNQGSSPRYSAGESRYDDGEEEYGNGFFMDNLKDSLLLTRMIIKDLLPLIDISDYERPLLNLLETMVDSSRISGEEYGSYLPKFLLEAKQEMKKQLISEKYKSIEKAQTESSEKKNSQKEQKDYGNRKLSSYATLLMPFYDSNPMVRQFMQQMLTSADNQLKYTTALLLLRHSKPLPDSLLSYFASLDGFRYELYRDLKDLSRSDLFPVRYASHLDIAKSQLLNLNSYEVPDTIAYLQKLPLQFKERKGWVYFFKYRQNKEDGSWKIAMAGLIPEAPNAYEFVKGTRKEEYAYNFTGMTSAKLDEDMPVTEQLEKALRKKMYSKSKSGLQFYDDENRNSPFQTNYNFRD